MVIKSLYKYMPHREGKFFDNFLLRATERADLNDPFEFLPPKDFFDVVVEFHRNRDPKWSNNITYEEFSESFLLLDGVISFTETRSNLLMWSHYAQNHSGIVVEFDINNEFFKDIKRVRYDNVKPHHIHVDDLENLFFVKSNDWIYEKEWRIIKRLSKHNSYIKKSDKNQTIYPAKNSANHFGGIPEEMYMFLVPKESIKSVTFGVNIDKKIKIKIYTKIKKDKSLSNIKLWETVLSKEYYHLEFIEFK